MDSTWVTIGILLSGVIVVIGGVLVFKLHAFLALILGALVVSFLTPARSIERHSLEKAAIPILSIDAAANSVVLDLGEKQGARPGMPYLALRPDPQTGEIRQIAELEIERIETVELADGARTMQSVAVIRDAETSDPLEADDLVVHPFDWQAAQTLASQTVGERVADGFGRTAAQLGILIAMASIVGKCLLDSGAADRIVRSTLRFVGEPRAPLAFLSSGFTLGIPVFFDTVFYLMVPLGKAMRMRTGRNYLLYVLSIVAGATMAHSLVPPTPGPLLVAEQLGVDIGLMILAGGTVGLFTSTVGYLFAMFANRKWNLPLRESPDFSLKELEKLSQRDDSELPPFWLALLPILLPVLLIGGYWVLRPLGGQLPAGFMALAETVGNKNIALVIAAVVALGMLVWQKRTRLAELSAGVQAALASGGVIILITSGGGAFGNALQQTGVAGLIQQIPHVSPIILVTLAFLITTAVRTAQGSATVAMITAVGILSGVANTGQLGFDPVYLALAIGCGSKPISWMNDSGFWVIVKMSGMTEAEGLKFVTPMTALMGIAGLIVVIIGVTLFPMA